MKGKKEYIPSHVVSVEGTLSAAYCELERYWDDCLNHPVWFNKKIREHVAYDLDGKMLYVRNMKYVEDEDGVLYPTLIGVYGRRPTFNYG